jgi:cytochrome c oxidase assembly protein subunit 15
MASMQFRRVSPRIFQLIALSAVWALALTIVSGAAVRLTGSGLGCPDWPKCTSTGVVAPLQYHAWVEFGNRLINAFVSVASIGALIAAFLRSPRRRDLTLLSAGLTVGLLAEVVLGGLTVTHKLAPGFVMSHFLLAVFFLGDAVLLYYRASISDFASGAKPEPLTGRPQLIMGRLVLAATAVVVTLGTIVTSTGPHGGDPKAQRFHLSLHSIAQLHGTSVEVLLAITLLTMWSLARSGAPSRVLRRAQMMFLVMAAQAGIGYIQYFNGDPVGVVAIHVAGACALVIAVLWFNLGLTAHPEPAPAGVTVTPAPAATSEPVPLTTR